MFGPKNFKVIESQGVNGLFIVLSHCWGGVDDTSPTTAQNIAERMASGLDLSGLPGNFQHSIACTRRLGYDYMWFDSLCILQHDVLNWRHEAGRMAGYCNSAVVTLATADAMNCHIGFLHRGRKDYSPPIRGDDSKFHCFREVLPAEHSINVYS